MQWVLNGEVDVTAHKGTLYIIDSECRPCVNRLDGKGTQPIGPDQATDENASEDPRDLAADICARHAGVPTWTPADEIAEEMTEATT